MAEEPSRMVVKKVVLLALQEKRDTKAKELEVLERDEKVRKYLELKAGVSTLDVAVRQTELELARVNVGAPPAESTLAQVRGSRFKIRSMGGTVLAMVKPYPGSIRLRPVRQLLYSEMLAEFRGKSDVTAAKVGHFFKRKFGASMVTANLYLIYAVQRGTAVGLKVDARGHVLLYEFPSRYDGRIVSEGEVPEIPIEEFRKAGLVK